MALQINTGLTTIDGGSVNSGAHVIFSTSFPYRGLSYNVDIRIYRSLGALDGGMAPIKVLEIPETFFTQSLSQQEYLDLTPTAIHEVVQEYLENFVGVGNVDILL